MLVVDDAASSRKMLIRLLRGRCRTCVEAEDGQQAVQLVRAALAGGPNVQPIDLIIMDSEMPVLDGLQATTLIREMGYKGAIFGVKGNASEEDVATFISQGADAVLPKPLDIKAFDLAVKHLL